MIGSSIDRGGASRRAADWAPARAAAARLLWVPLLALAIPARGQIVLGDLPGRVPYAWYGASVDTAGDVDRDGVPDLVVGAPFDSEAGWGAGALWIVSGADGSTLAHRTGEAPGDYLGWSVGRAGDVDRDGVPDVIAGAYGSDAAGEDAGRVYVLSGRDASPLFVLDGDAPGDLFGYAVGTAGDVDLDGHPDLLAGAYGGNYARLHSGADASLLAGYAGDAPGDRFGCSVAGVGDLDGDGTPDVAVGANQLDSGGRGYVRAFSGGDGTSLFQVRGQSSRDWFGWAIAALGDVNGDGTSDLVVGAPFRSAAGEDAGTVYVISGLDGSTLYSVAGRGAGEWFGRSVARVGDLDGDGTLEFAVGAPGAVLGGDLPGRVTVHRGSDGTELGAAEGSLPGESFGTCVRGVGDLDRDGFADLVVGAPRSDTAAGVDAGAAAVLSAAALWCSRGSVDLVNGSAAPVLFVNGETGGTRRTVHVAEGAALQFSMALPPGGGRGKFVVHANAGLPGGSGLTILPESIGTLCRPVLLTEGAAPLAIWNNLGKEPRLGSSVYFDGTPLPDPDPAPTDFVDLPGGDSDALPAGTRILLQGLILDPGSPSPRLASATNAVTLAVD